MIECCICHKESNNLIESFDFDPEIGQYEILVCSKCLDKYH